MRTLTRYAMPAFVIAGILATLMGLVTGLFEGSLKGFSTALDIFERLCWYLALFIGGAMTIFTAVQIGMVDFLDPERAEAEEKRRAGRLITALYCLGSIWVGSTVMTYGARNLNAGDNFWSERVLGLLFAPLVLIVVHVVVWYLYSDIFAKRR